MTKHLAENLTKYGFVNTLHGKNQQKSLLNLIDNTVPSMVNSGQMSDAQPVLADLKSKGWTNASIADEIGVTVNAVEKWQAGERNISQSHLILLNQLTKRTRVPPRKRYAKGSRRQVVTSE